LKNRGSSASSLFSPTTHGSRNVIIHAHHSHEVHELKPAGPGCERRARAPQPFGGDLAGRAQALHGPGVHVHRVVHQHGADRQLVGPQGRRVHVHPLPDEVQVLHGVLNKLAGRVDQPDGRYVRAQVLHDSAEFHRVRILFFERDVTVRCRAIPRVYFREREGVLQGREFRGRCCTIPDK